MPTISFALMSVNDCWKGRRYKTDEYKDWREDMGWKLKQLRLPKIKGWVGIEVDFYTSTFHKSDLDNFEKPFYDVLVENEIIEDDKLIKWHHCEKFQVKLKEEEKIVFRITPLSSI